MNVASAVSSSMSVSGAEGEVACFGHVSDSAR
jgi:hypothetical protein